MTRLAPYAVPAVCSGAVFAWEERALRQNCQIQRKSRDMYATIHLLVGRCLSAFEAGYLATSVPMGVMLIVAPYMGYRAALPVFSFEAKKLQCHSEFTRSKKFTITALSGMGLAALALRALYAPSMHWGKQAVVIAIYNYAIILFYGLYRRSLQQDESEILVKADPWLTAVIRWPVGIGLVVAWKNPILTSLVMTPLIVLCEQVAIRCFASS